MPSKSRAAQLESAVPVEGSPDLIEIAFRTPANWIGDPAVDVRFMPAGPVGADFELGRERALGDLTVDGGPGQSSPGEDGFQPDDAVWFSHGRTGSGWLFLMASETRQDSRCRPTREFLASP